jgi:hypothetical protein
MDLTALDLSLHGSETVREYVKRQEEGDKKLDQLKMFDEE